MPTFPILPTEIWMQIVDALRYPSNPLAYRLDPGCNSALYQLCRVNRTLNELTEMTLYSRAFVRPGSLDSFVRAVTIVERNQWPPSSYRPSEKGKLVESLALAHFDDHIDHSTMQLIATILCALRTSLTRLFFDVNIGYNYPTDRLRQPLYPKSELNIHHALMSLERIEEFCLAKPVVFDGPKIPAWKTLKRLAVHKIFLDASLLRLMSQMDTLETCILVRPDMGALRFRRWDGDDMFNGSWTQHAQELIITVMGLDGDAIVDALVRGEVRLTRFQSVAVRESRKRRPGMSVLKLMEEHEWNSDLWFFQNLLSGEIWGKDRIPWAEYRHRSKGVH
ncbi:hypothetical protein FRB94_014102 [Tulasnella sp. JGI-2019a]|nr:hypothetical protein FRB93_013119 [Tulasnella sp. JGI-2019a]KAG9007680.1 hypothetical protein FRB94_014102 [Tulasnella sp. JGI-2019a]KAG9028354.1 hypothetical protein FRB95_006581 [Tulasnella sp. JGI-2019a]